MENAYRVAGLLVTGVFVLILSGFYVSVSHLPPRPTPLMVAYLPFLMVLWVVFSCLCFFTAYLFKRRK